MGEAAGATGKPRGAGALLVLLHRRATTTDVLVVPVAAGGAELPHAGARHGLSQRALVEQLIEASPIAEVERLYASALSVPGAGGLLGVFVAFVRRQESGTPAGAWMDLREASGSLAPAWSGVLQGVRERFVAKPPDEALRLR